MNAESKSGKLRDKVAIVTGGGSGIGAATCRLFAKEGAKVVVADMEELAAKKVAKEIDEKGEQAIATKVDVSSKDEIVRTVQDALSRWGKIDILVNCAAIGESVLFIQHDDSTWDKIYEVNLKGTMLFTRAVLPNMIERKYGKIINIASLAGKTGAGLQVVYSASKGGVDAFTKALAREVARYNINVNDICPGPVDTPMFARLADSNPEIPKRFVQGTAQRRAGRPDELAAGVLFLASDDCEFITGHSLIIDGGTSMI